VVKASGNINIGISEYIRTQASIDLVPRIRLILESDSNFVTFQGPQLPKELMDITSKIIVEHGANPLQVTGEPRGKSFLTIPPIVAHEGTAPIFFNGVLSNFHDQYCVCEGIDCQSQCSELPIVGYSEKEIRRTIFHNPHRVVRYLVRDSSSTKRPFFGLHDFHSKSFMVTSFSERREFVSLEGAPDIFSQPPSSVSHTFRNVDLMLANPGYYLFNNGVFTNVSITKNITAGNYKVVQKGMTVDFVSLAALWRNDLLFPSSLYLLVNGGSNLRRVKLLAKDKILLVGIANQAEIEIPIDLSSLSHPITLAVEAGKQAEPFVVTWEIPGSYFHISESPKLRIDLSGTDGEDAYVLFNGRDWTGAYHNLSEAISLDRGQLNIHIENVRDSKTGEYAGQPPHVNLLGTGDYYINGVKQVSVLSLGQHEDSILGDDTNWPGIFVILAVCGIVGAGLALFFCLPRQKLQPPKPRIEPTAERDDDASHFGTVDEPEVEP
jgi:hypothetical protein